ncbi:recombinase family protein [Enterococcus hirae]|jgi:DNA invertase Pin-like site-specific DNA recombinase|nr:recombinase family protein [Enterococcaceae bacterium]MCI1919707.1 recombinase family protein [Enterococcaceae bacterium]MDM8212472.1 recombinase family protein [Enterococcus hirae]
MSVFGYARTTINDSDLNSQIKTLDAYGCEMIISEDFEAKEKVCSQLDKIIAEMHEDDVLVVTELKRLGKSTRQLTELSHHFQENALHLVSLAENIDTRTEKGDCYFRLMDGLSKMECDLIKERTLIGLNEARKKGKIGGRPKIDCKTVKKIRRLYFDKKETIQFISNKCNVSVGTCYKYINLPEAELEKLFQA